MLTIDGWITLALNNVVLEISLHHLHLVHGQSACLVSTDLISVTHGL